jgi:hypothetical protein
VSLSLATDCANFHTAGGAPKATRQQLNIAIEFTQALLANEHRLSLIATRWTMEILKTHPLQRPVTIDEATRFAAPV